MLVILLLSSTFFFCLYSSPMSAQFLEAGQNISGTDMVRCAYNKTFGRDHKESLRTLEPLVTKVLAQSSPVAWKLEHQPCRCRWSAVNRDAEFFGHANAKKSGLLTTFMSGRDSNRSRSSRIVNSPPLVNPNPRHDHTTPQNESSVSVNGVHLT